jgi:type IV pilus assembly protein PilP
MKRILTFCLVLLLSACGDPIAEIQKFMKELEKTLPAPKLDPIKPPPIEPTSDFVVDSLKDPFLVPKQVATSRKQRDPLEAFPLKSLKMVGMLGVEEERRALILSPDGKIHLVGPGRYMGTEGARVKAIGEKELVYEIVSYDNSGHARTQTNKIFVEKGDHVQASP